MSNREVESELMAPPGRRTKVPRVGFLGLGWIGRSRMQAAVASGRIAPVALADPAPETLKEVASVAPDAARLTSLDELLSMDLDAVVIATPSALHAEQSIRALQHGLAVFCQKPLGRSAAEVRAVLNAARAADRLLGVDLSYRYMRGVALMRRMIQDGEIGDVFAVRAVFHNAYGPGKDWFFDRTLSGGGCVIDLGIHLVDLILWSLAFPEVTDISSRLFRRGRPFRPDDNGVEDYASARLDLSGGAVAELACSWHLNTGCDAVIELEFQGTRGALVLQNVNGSYFDFLVRRRTGRSEEVIAEPPDDWGGRAICEWADQLVTAPRFDPAIEESEHVASILDAIYERSTE